MTPNREQLLALAERVEAADYRETGGLTIQVLAAFGLEQRFYRKAGWKIIYPDSGRPGSALWPMRRLEDFLTMLSLAGTPLPPMIHSRPKLATAAALRAIAEGSANG